MIGKPQCVVLDCPDVLELARFYQSLLGGEVNEPDRRWAVSDDFSTLHTGSGLVFAFQRVKDHRAPRWPDSTYPRQFHRTARPIEGPALSALHDLLVGVFSRIEQTRRGDVDIHVVPERLGVTATPTGILCNSHHREMAVSRPARAIASGPYNSSSYRTRTPCALHLPSYCGDRDRRDSWGHGIQETRLRRRVP